MSSPELARAYNQTPANSHIGRLVLASPNTFQTSPEQQLRYDLTTLFAEMVDGNMRTEFELQFDGDDLIGEDGRGMDEITAKSLADAKKMAKQYPFEVRRRHHERDEFKELIEMAGGKGPNTMVVVSDFPAELMDAKEDVGGYNVTRQQTMLRVIYRQPGSNIIRMYSQTLDGSNRQALEAIYRRFGIKPPEGELLGERIRIDLTDKEQFELTDKVTETYDQNLAEQFGGNWYAGRRPADYRNTYDFVCAQTDLINECMRLNTLGWLNDDYRYKISATMQKRFEGYKKGDVVTSRQTLSELSILHREIALAGQQAYLEGRSFSGCGATMHGGRGRSSFKSQLKLSGYGNKAFDESDEDEENWQWTEGECIVEDCPTRPSTVEVGPCSVCRRCQAIFDAGGQP